MPKTSKPNTLTESPGTKEFGLEVRQQVAGYLAKELPPRQRAKILAGLVKGQADGDAAYASQIASRLAALRYVDELTGVVTVAQEKGAQAVLELPQILIAADAPPPSPGSAEALRLLATAKGSQYDEAFPASPEPPPEPPKPFKSAVTVTEA